jgi:hypothetical protein
MEIKINFPSAKNGNSQANWSHTEGWLYLSEELKCVNKYLIIYYSVLITNYKV